MWLTFDEPVGLSMVRLLNYSKDPARGVQEFELVGDGLLVYRGWLRKAEPAAQPADWQSVVLNDVEEVVQAERAAGRLAGLVRANEAGDESDFTLLWDEGKRMNRTPLDDMPTVATVEHRPATACKASNPSSARAHR